MGVTESIPVEYIDVGVLVHSKSLLLGMIYEALGQPEVARPHYESAQGAIESKLIESPGDPRVRSLLGMVYARLGRKDDAIREGKKGVDLCPISKDALDGPRRLKELAEIYVVVGEYDAALDEIEYLLERLEKILID